MSSRLHVLHLIESGGGSGKQVAYICNGLPKDVFEVTLVYSLRPDSPDYESELEKCRRIYLPMQRQIRPLRDLRDMFRIWRLLRRLKPDILHAHSSKAGFLGRVAGRLAGVPVILYSPRGFSFLRQDVTPWTRALYFLLEWLAARLGDGIIAVSEEEARLARRLTRRVELVRNCIFPLKPPDGASLAGTCIACLGRITFARDPQRFIRIAAEIQRRIPSARFLWIGDGEMRGELLACARQAGLKHLEITGWLPRPEALRKLRRAALLLWPSRWEGLPNAVLEAMSLGIPVVASDIIGNRDAIVHGRTGYLARSDKEFLHYVERLIRNPRLRRRMGRAARRRVLIHFNSKDHIRRLQKIYLEFFRRR